MLHVIHIVFQPAYLYHANPVISTVTPVSDGTCAELCATQSKVPHHTYTWLWGTSWTRGGHLLNSWGPPLEFSLRLARWVTMMSLVLLLLILLLTRLNILIILYTCYTHCHAGVWQCGTKYHTEQSATPHAWWGPPLESVRANLTSRGVGMIETFSVHLLFRPSKWYI